MEANPTGKMNKTLFKALWDAMKGEIGENADLVYGFVHLYI